MVLTLHDIQVLCTHLVLAFVVEFAHPLIGIL